MFDIAFVFRTVAAVYINLGGMADLQDFLQKVRVVKKKILVLFSTQFSCPVSVIISLTAQDKEGKMIE